MLNFNEWQKLETLIEEEIQKEAKNVFGNELDDPEVARMKMRIKRGMAGQREPQTEFEKEVEANKKLPGQIKNLANVYTGVKHLIKNMIAQSKKSPEELAAEKEAEEKEEYRQRVISALKRAGAPKR